jgi:WASH complex subunit CCDC53
MDTSRSPPIPIKRTLVLVNEFVTSTTRFLNHLYTLSEERLQDVSRKIKRVETSLILMEARLARIPDFTDVDLGFASHERPMYVRCEVALSYLRGGVARQLKAVSQ